MDLDKQKDVLIKKRENLYKRFIKPLDDDILKIEGVIESFKNQTAINFDTTEKLEQFDRLNKPFEYPNRPDLKTWDELERNKNN